MIAYRRAYEPGGCYFFTVVTYERRPLLIDHILNLRSAFSHALEQRPAQMDALVILPDHLHTLWRLPPGDSDVSGRWTHIKRLFSAQLMHVATTTPSQAEGDSGVWQRGFGERLVESEQEWRRYMDYIHYNPVRHGLCQRPIEWPYGTFRSAVAEGLYNRDWGRELPDSIAGLDLE
ncbi:MAG: transposase [Thiohalocapsa sp.]|uniref:REP-associated tyrosine transposase n=1 Tax=Thiohalocapsa sp. TaxID=2497641 RepID=UPI0025DB36AF|nr:transposase [Thiohalocapsa sp.]MCG6943156.1 transposase [Thiohalocapsa sp.]